MHALSYYGTYGANGTCDTADKCDRAEAWCRLGFREMSGVTVYNASFMIFTINIPLWKHSS